LHFFFPNLVFKFNRREKKKKKKGKIIHALST